MRTRDLTDKDQKHQIHSLHHPTDVAEQLVITGGKGIEIQDAEGHTYIDGLSSLWNVNVGYGRMELAEAAAAQMRSLAYYSGYAGTTTIPSIQLAERLMQLAPGMAAVFFASGGAEANEAALKTARFYWKALGKSGKLKVIARQYAYHGATMQTMSATGIPAYWKMFEPRIPGFIHIQTCYPYRFQGARPGETVGQAAARELEEAILREGPDTIAAFIGEPIHGAGGVIYPTDDYWPLVRAVCDKYDVLLIADEIVTAFGRTGRWFGMEHWGLTPDICSFAKGVTSGYLPLGGILMTRKVREAIESVAPADRWMHGYTNSGQPTCCAVALENIRILEGEGLLENSARMGRLLWNSLQEKFGNHPHVGDIRGGKGLLAALEFVQDRETRENFAPAAKVGLRIKAELKNLGILTRMRGSEGPHPAAGDQILYAPPLCITESDVQRMVESLRQSVQAVLGS
ncbi:MAG: aspartate aminotransferase family protein [Terracidiphilus sp.]